MLKIRIKFYSLFSNHGVPEPTLFGLHKFNDEQLQNCEWWNLQCFTQKAHNSGEKYENKIFDTYQKFYQVFYKQCIQFILFPIIVC